MGESLLPYQSRWVEDRSTLKLALHARKIGMTSAAAAEAAAEAKAGVEVHYIALGRQGARAFEDDYCAAAGSPARAIECHVLDARTEAGRDAVRLLRGLVIIDDAAWRDDFNDLMACLAGPLMMGARVAVISSYREGSAFLDLVGSVRAGERQANVHEISIYDAIADGLYKRICSVSGEEWSEKSQAGWLTNLRGLLGDSFEAECMCRSAEEARSTDDWSEKTVEEIGEAARALLVEEADRG